jgi:hypothetical protein
MWGSGLQGWNAQHLHVPLTHLCADVVEDRYGDGDEPDGDARRAVVQQADPLDEQEADPTASHCTDDGGHAHVDVPTIYATTSVSSKRGTKIVLT